MRKAVIDINKVSVELMAMAKEQLGASLAAGQLILAFGLPVKDGINKPTDSTASLAVLATCTECGKPIWSSELKETILHIAPDRIHICCLECFTPVVKAYNKNVDDITVVHKTPGDKYKTFKM